MRKHRWKVWSSVALGGLVLVALVVRLVLDPIAAHYTQKALDDSDSVKGRFASVHVALFPPGYHIERLKLIEVPGGDWSQPLFYAEETRLSIVWRALFHRQLVARVAIHKPKLIAVSKPEQKPKQPPPELAQLLQRQLPLRIDRIDVSDGEVLLARGKGDEAPSLWLNRMELVAQNLATRKALMEGEPATLRLDARVQRSGNLVVDATINPLAKALTFSLKAALRGLDARELYAVLAPATQMAPKQGAIDVFADLRARDGELRGGVKPELVDLEVASVEGGLGPRIKAALADATIDILEDERGEHGVAATTVPIKGSVKDLHVQVVPAVLGAVRNALVVGLSSGFANLPPPTAEKKEGVIKQAWKALKRDEGPPKAEPEAGDARLPEGPRQGRGGHRRPQSQTEK
jgi:hypothetical protein